MQLSFNCQHCLPWNWYREQPKISEKDFIAPAHNLPSENSFFEYPPTDELIDYFSTILDRAQHVAKNPIILDKPVSGYGAAMALSFISDYQRSQDLHNTASYMSNGANAACVDTTWFYNNLINAFVDPNTTHIDDEKVVLRFIRSATAEAMSIQLTDEITLRYPIEEIISFLKEALEPGEYLVPLSSHFVAIIKNNQGDLYLFDPNQGTVSINSPEAQEWFLDLLKSHNIHIDEELIFLKATTLPSQSEEQELKIEELCFSEPPEELIFEKGEGRWGSAVLKWRGEIHRLAWDSEANKIYNPDSEGTIRFKCLLLAARTLPEDLIQTIYNIGITILNIGKLPFTWDRSAFTHRCHVIYQTAIAIFRVLFYSIAATCAALYGIVKPLDGRRLYNNLEEQFHSGTQETASQKKRYKAPCFRPWKIDTKTPIERRLLQYKEINKHFCFNLIRTCL